MWTNVVNEGGDLQWVVDAMANGTATWVTDGSYNRKVAPLVSGAGWIVYCSHTKQKMHGSFLNAPLTLGLLVVTSLAYSPSTSWPPL